MKTKAAVLYEIGKPLVLEELEVPELQSGQVLVRMLSSGVCHTQLNEIKGYRGEDKYLPHLLGHEGSGIVERIGPGITKVKEGDYIVLSWIRGGGLHASSSCYQSSDKKINSGALATFTQYTIASENRVTPLTRRVPPDVAALLGCAVPTGGGIILHKLKPEKNKTLAVFGVGGVGASALLVAKAYGARIIAIDIHDHKLDFAKKLGATYTLHAHRDDILHSIYDFTDGAGVDYSIEASGARASMELAYASVNRDRGVTVLAGNLRKGEKICIDPFDLLFGKILTGTGEHTTKPERDFLRYAEMYLEGTLDLEKLITHRYHLEEINEAFLQLEQGNVCRAIIDFLP